MTGLGVICNCCHTEPALTSRVSFAVYRSDGSLVFAAAANKDFEGSSSRNVKALAVNLLDNSVYCCPVTDKDGNAVSWITRFKTDATEDWTLTSGSPEELTITDGATSWDVPAHHFMDSDDSGNLYVWTGTEIKKYLPDSTLDWTYNFESDRGGANVDASKISRLRCFGDAVYIAGYNVDLTSGARAQKTIWKINNAGSFVEALPTGEDAGFTLVDSSGWYITAADHMLGDFVILSGGDAYYSVQTNSSPGGLAYIGSDGELEWHKDLDDIGSLTRWCWNLATDGSNTYVPPGDSYNTSFSGPTVYVVDNAGANVREMTVLDSDVYSLDTSTAEKLLSSHRSGDSSPDREGYAVISDSDDSIITDIVTPGPVGGRICKRAKGGGLAISFPHVPDSFIYSP